MLALILAQALAAAPAPAPSSAPLLIPPAGTYTYITSMQGATIGKTTLMLKALPSGAAITETGTANFMGESGSFSDALTLGPDLAPASYEVQGQLGPRAFTAQIAMQGPVARQSGTLTQSYTLAAATTHFTVLDLGPFSGYFMLPAEEAAWKDAPALAIAPAVGRAFVIAPDAAPSPSPTRPAGVPVTDALLAFSSPVAIQIWYDPKTALVDEVDVPMQQAAIKRVP